MGLFVGANNVFDIRQIWIFYSEDLWRWQKKLPVGFTAESLNSNTYKSILFVLFSCCGWSHVAIDRFYVLFDGIIVCAIGFPISIYVLINYLQITV